MTDKKPSSITLVRDLMTVGVPTCPTDTPVVDLARLMLEKDFESVVVLDGNGHAVGYVDREALVNAYADGKYHEALAEAVMHDGLPSFPPDIPLAAAAQLMRDQKVRVVYMTHHAGGIEYPAAWLTYKHLIRHLALKDGEELSDLGIEAKRESPIETFVRRREEARRRAIQRNK